MSRVGKAATSMPEMRELCTDSPREPYCVARLTALIEADNIRHVAPKIMHWYYGKSSLATGATTARRPGLPKD